MSTINCLDNNISQNIFFGTAWGKMMKEFSSNIHIPFRGTNMEGFHIHNINVWYFLLLYYLMCVSSGLICPILQ